MIGRRKKDTGILVREMTPDFRRVTIRNAIIHGEQRLVAERKKIESVHAASTDLYLELWQIAEKVCAEYDIHFAEILDQEGETLLVEFVTGEGLGQLAEYLDPIDRALFDSVVDHYLSKINILVNQRILNYFEKHGYFNAADVIGDEVSVMDAQRTKGWWFVSDIEPKNMVLPNISGPQILQHLPELNQEQKASFFQELIHLCKVIDPINIAAEVFRS